MGTLDTQGQIETRVCLRSHYRDVKQWARWAGTRDPNMDISRGRTPHAAIQSRNLFQMFKVRMMNTFSFFDQSL